MTHHRADPDDIAAATAAAGRDADLPVGLLGEFADLLAGIGARPEPGTAELATFALYGVGAAEAGASLRQLIDLYLSAVWRLWPHLPELRVALAAGDPGRVSELAVGVMRVSDSVVVAVGQGYQQARRLALRAEEAGRREFVDDLLSGGADPVSVTERADHYGLRLAAPHLVLVLQADRRLGDAGPIATDLAEALARWSGSADVLVASKDGLLICLLPAPGDQRSTGDWVLRRVQAMEPRRWRVAESRARSGVGGVRRGWFEARESLELADRLGLAADLIRADDLLAYQVLLRDRAAVTDLVQRVLGPLTTARGGAQPLVATLQALVDAGGVVAAAARALHLSVRAVLYRIDRIQQLTGFRLDDPVGRYTLHTAAVGARLLPWPPVQ